MAHVIISAGHSPVDKGAVIGDLVEYDLTQKITDALEELIKDYPKLEYKRIPTGLSLPQKIQWINSSGMFAENNDIAVEIHINDKDGEGSEDGVECWHAERGANASRELCLQLMNHVCEESGLRKRSINSEYDHPFRRLGYVHNTRTISALIEIGFMDHPKDKKIITSDTGIKKVAKGLLKGILAYYGLKEEDKDKEPEAKPKFPIHTDPGVDMMPTGMPPMMPGAMPTQIPNYNPMYNSAMPQGNAMGYGMPSGFPTSLPSTDYPAATESTMTAQERQDMIQRLFQKVLGRNADPKSMSYYSTSQMSEDALMKLMVDSTEHKNLIKAAKNFVSTKSLLNRANQEIAELKSKLKDKDVEIDSLRQFFGTKNQTTSSATDLKEKSPDKLSAEDVLPAIGDRIEIEKTSDGIQDERFAHGSGMKKGKSSKINTGGSTLKSYTLKTIRRPEGPLKAFKKLANSIGKMIVKD